MYGRALAHDLGIGLTYIERVGECKTRLISTTHGEPTSPATGRKVTSPKQVDYIVRFIGEHSEKPRAKYEEKIGHEARGFKFSAAASKCIETLKGRIDKGEVERDEFDKQVLEEIQQGR
jgi:hypothetical protein